MKAIEKKYPYKAIFIIPLKYSYVKKDKNVNNS